MQLSEKVIKCHTCLNMKYLEHWPWNCHLSIISPAVRISTPPFCSWELCQHKALQITRMWLQSHMIVGPLWDVRKMLFMKCQMLHVFDEGRDPDVPRLNRIRCFDS